MPRLTSTERSRKLRAKREARGIKRRELYLTDAQWKIVKAYAKGLQNGTQDR